MVNLSNTRESMSAGNSMSNGMWESLTASVGEYTLVVRSDFIDI